MLIAAAPMSVFNGIRIGTSSKVRAGDARSCRSRRGNAELGRRSATD
jgi:hypothetical protein